MNSKFFLSIALALTVTLTVQAQDDDDLYFTPTKKSQKSVSTKVYNDCSRNDDEYNRRYTGYAGSWQTGGNADSISTDSLQSEVEYAQSSQSDYDLTDPENDYVYSRRILRFHSPRFGFAISSPYYWDLVYDWGVYDYLYDPYYDYFYDPFYWSWGWGYGWAYRPWNTWYGPIWGWNHAPHGWHDWGWGPMWHDHGPVARYTGRGFGAGRFAENRFSANPTGNFGSRAVNSANGSRNIVSGTTTRTVNTRNNGRTGTFTSRAAEDQVRTEGNNRFVTVNRQNQNSGTRDVRNYTERNVQYNQSTGTRTVNTRNNTSRNTEVNTRSTNVNTSRTVTAPTRGTSTVTNTRSFGGGGGNFGGGRSGGGSFGGGGSRGGGTGRR